MVHQFRKSLSREQKLIQEKKHLPALVSLNKQMKDRYGVYFDFNTYQEYTGNSSHDMLMQKRGIDAGCEMVCIKTNERKFCTWDYKFRFKSYGDFLAETVSVDHNNTPGWAIDPNKTNNFIINIDMVTKQVVFVVRKELRDAIISNKFSDIREQKSINRGYNTKFIAIPLTTLQQHCQNTLIFTHE